MPKIAKQAALRATAVLLGMCASTSSRVRCPHRRLCEGLANGIPRPIDASAKAATMLERVTLPAKRPVDGDQVDQHQLHRSGRDEAARNPTPQVGERAAPGVGTSGIDNPLGSRHQGESPVQSGATDVRIIQKWLMSPSSVDACQADVLRTTMVAGTAKHTR